GKTPVIIAEQVEWVAQDALNARRNDLAAAINQWRLDWESRDTTRLLNHYSASFHSGAQNLLAFAANKQKVNADKSWIKVGLDNVSLMLYPQGAGLVSKDAEASTTTLNPERSDFALVSFVQNYQSNTLNDRTTKRQFWSRENGRWKIIHETSL
ncbi:MAG: hypothetical protein Q7T90_06740, partial [Thiobacillus sp.]|nr:hypothetical protein [Thiobacillus sp.]